MGSYPRFVKDDQKSKIRKEIEKQYLLLQEVELKIEQRK